MDILVDVQGVGSYLAVACLAKSSAVTSQNIHLPKVTCSLNQSLITLHHHLESTGREIITLMWILSALVLFALQSSPCL